VSGRSRPEREDQRREWALWILVAADLNQQSPREAANHVANSFVELSSPPSSAEKSEFFQLERFEDYLPEPVDWGKLSDEVRETITNVELNQAEIDETIRQASPKWKVERMPVIDRNLLRIGVAEMRYRSTPRPRATLNGLIELAKSYGESSSPKFVNGILDQIRKDLELPFV
jgi:N utilization substance protein B